MQNPSCGARVSPFNFSICLSSLLMDTLYIRAVVMSLWGQSECNVHKSELLWVKVCQWCRVVQRGFKSQTGKSREVLRSDFIHTQIHWTASFLFSLPHTEAHVRYDLALSFVYDVILRLVRV